MITTTTYNFPLCLNYGFDIHLFCPNLDFYFIYSRLSEVKKIFFDLN